MDKKTTKAILRIIFLTILLIFALWHIDTVISVIVSLFKIIRPIIIGFIIAFVLKNLLKSIENFYIKIFRKSNTGKAAKYTGVLTVYFLFLTFVSTVVIIVVPQLVKSIDMFKDNLETYINNAQDFSTKFTDRFDFESLKDINISEKINEILEKVTSVIPIVLKGAFGFTTSLVGTITDIVIGFVISVYFLVGKDRLWLQFKKVLFAFMNNDKAGKTISFLEKANITFTKFVKGQITEAFILGTLCFIGMSIFRFDYAFLIATLIGVTSLIPILGAFIGTIPGVFILWLVDPMKAVWFVVFIIVLQQIEGNLIYPKVVGTNVGLPALWVLLAITIGGGLYGVIGMMISVPLMSLIYESTRAKVNLTLKEKNIKID